MLNMLNKLSKLKNKLINNRKYKDKRGGNEVEFRLFR